MHPGVLSLHRSLGLLRTGLFAILILVAFGANYTAPFLAWDDQINFSYNQAFQGLGWQQLSWAWRTNLLNVYQPLAWMLFEVQYSIAGLDTRLYHAVSFGLFWLILMLLTSLTEALLAGVRPLNTADRLIIICIVALFAIHPLRTETVVWISCQPYLLATVCYLGASLAYLRVLSGAPRRTAWYLLAVVCGLASMLAKAVAVSLPATLLIMEAWLAATQQRKLTRASAGRLVPFIIAAVACAVMALLANHSPLRAQLNLSTLPGQMLNTLYQLGTYITLTLWPPMISTYYPQPAIELWSAHPQDRLILGLGAAWVALAGLSLARVWTGRSHDSSRALLAVMTASTVILLPNLGLVKKLDEIIANRYAFLSQIPWVILLAGVCIKIKPIAASPARRWKQLTAVVCCLICLLAALTRESREQALAWSQSDRFWQHAWERYLAWWDTPMRRTGAGQLAFYHARQMMSQGEVTTAEELLQRTLTLNPNHAKALHDLGYIFIQRNQLTEALPILAKASEMSPPYGKAAFAYAMVLAATGDHDAALTAMRKAVQIEPNSFTANSKLGDMLRARGEYREAARAYEIALCARPTDEVTSQTLEATIQRWREHDHSAEYKRSPCPKIISNDSAEQTLWN